MLLRKNKSILDNGSFHYEQLFQPVQSTASKISQCNSKDKLFLPKATDSLTISDQFHCP